MIREDDNHRGFNGPLMLRVAGMRYGRQHFVTLGKSVYRDLDGDLCIAVPKGTITDFASVPWGLRWLVPQMGRYNPATVLHDHLCQRKKCSRFIADAIFRDAMAVLKVPLWRRVLMYYGVRAYAVLLGKK